MFYTELEEVEECLTVLSVKVVADLRGASSLKNTEETESLWKGCLAGFSQLPPLLSIISKGFLCYLKIGFCMACLGVSKGNSALLSMRL